MKSLSPTFKLVIKIALGLLFCLSAVMKTISIDQFELYLFSMHLFNLNISAWLARIVIGAEFCLGLGFLFNIYHKLFWYAYLLMLSGFSLFLTYLICIGRQDNCHCFGELIDFNPWQSLLKNVIFIGLLLPIRQCREFTFGKKQPVEAEEAVQQASKAKNSVPKIWLAGIIVLSFAGVFIYSPPDNVYTKYYQDGYAFDKDKFTLLIQDSSFVHTDILQGKKIVCMYSTGCKYCKLSSHKMALFQSRNPEISIVNIFWGKPQMIDTFYEESNSPHFPYVFVTPAQFLRITEDMPLILFLENGEIQEIFNYRNITEKDIRTFLN